MALFPAHKCRFRSVRDRARASGYLVRMSTSVITAYYDAFNAEDYPRMLALLSEDVAHDINQGGRQVGRAAFQKFLAHMAHCYREQVRELAVMVDASGKHAAAEFMVHGEYLATDAGFPPAHGQKYALPAGAFFTLQDGLITRVSTYYNVPAWLSQVAAPGRAGERAGGQS
jgi:steroid delta-isomerase-like uncharacterized protein